LKGIIIDRITVIYLVELNIEETIPESVFIWIMGFENAFKYLGSDYSKII
jgi:hypothetical protein